ncbi:MAG: hypothetical protein H6809_03985 [Phycisphaeraceae bacterium]|nr:hypothetical protein [Phycisphaeraceae bacterium]
MANPPTYEPLRFNPVAGVLAFLIPGAGHVYMGQATRGVLIGAGILGLFFGGMFIGGLSIVDSRSPRMENRISYYGQVLVGPAAIIVDRLHQSMFKAVDERTRTTRALNPGEVIIPAGDPRNGRNVPIIARAADGTDEGPPYVKSLGKVHEIGLLYTLVAGMLNLIVIIDAAFPGGRLVPGARKATTPVAAEAAALAASSARGRASDDRSEAPDATGGPEAGDVDVEV